MRNSPVIIHNSLNPEIWDAAYNLNPEIRLDLLKISDDFYRKSKFEAPVIDVYFMGSLASFNWNVESDIDIHVIVDLKALQMPEETAIKMVKLVSSQWNGEHNIEIKGHKVEMNIQDMAAEKPYVNGIYSIIKNQWIKKPSRQNIEGIDKSLIQIKYTGVKKYIDNSISSGNQETMKRAKDYLDAFRQYGLDTDGELSVENIVYKLLRKKGIIGKLKTSITNQYDKELSIDENADINSKTSNFHIEPNGTSVKIFLHDEWFCNSFRLQEGFGYNNMRDGEWVINAHTGAFRLKFKSPAISFPSLQELLNYLEEWYSNNIVMEIKQKDLKQRHPKPFYDKTFQSLNGLTLDNLNALREKSKRAYQYGIKNKQDDSIILQSMIDYQTYNDEIKKRLKYINKSMGEGVGAGVPENDPLHIKGHRWQIDITKRKTPKMLSESMNVYIDGASYKHRLDSVHDLTYYLCDTVLSPILRNLPKDQLDYFNKNKVGTTYDILTTDGSYWEKGEGNTGIINFYIAGFTSKTIKQVLLGIFNELKKLNITLGKFKREKSRMLNSEVIRVIITDNKTKYNGPPELNMSNRNAYHMFKEVLQFDPIDNGNVFRMSAQELKDRILSIQSDKDWVKQNQIQRKEFKPKPKPEEGDEWKQTDEPEPENPFDKSDNPHDQMAGNIGNQLGGTHMISMGLNDEDINVRLVEIFRVAEWALNNGYKDITVS